MPTLQRLYNACIASLTPKGPISEEGLEKVRSLLGKIKPLDVGLEQEAQMVRKWEGIVCTSDEVPHPMPPLTYLHVHECDSFSIGIFCMPPSSVIPLHHHPGMTVLTKLLYGSLCVTSYDWINVPGSCYSSDAARPAKVVKDCEMMDPCGTAVLYPTTGGNIHSFKAVTPCAIFDILSPPYSSREGRDCNYFKRSSADLPGRIEMQEGTVYDVTWLEEYDPPQDFIVRRGVYHGMVPKV